MKCVTHSFIYSYSSSINQQNIVGTCTVPGADDRVSENKMDKNDAYRERHLIKQKTKYGWMLKDRKVLDDHKLGADNRRKTTD